MRPRGVRMVLEQQGAHDSQWAALTSITAKLGCTAETSRHWVRQAERNAGPRPGLTKEKPTRLKQREREVVDPRPANEILLSRIIETGPETSSESPPARVSSLYGFWAITSAPTRGSAP